jgi:hypothetical protein
MNNTHLYIIYDKPIKYFGEIHKRQDEIRKKKSYRTKAPKS